MGGQDLLTEVASNGNPENSALALERSAIGAMILAGDTASLQPFDFVDPGCQAACQAILDVLTAGDDPDPANVGIALSRLAKVSNAHEWIRQTLMAAHPDLTAAAIAIKSASTRRRAMMVAARIMQEAKKPDTDPETLLQLVSQAVDELQAGMQSRSVNRLGGAVQEILDNYEGDAPRTGMPTGLKKLDLYLGSIRPGDLIVIGGRPSSGKTIFGLNLALRLAKPESPAMIFSLETSIEKLAYRALASVVGMSVQALERRDVPREVLAWAAPGIESLKSAPIWVDDDPSVNVSDIIRSARRFRRKHGLGLIVVDYLTLIDAKERRGETRAEAVGRVAYSLQKLARSLDVTVLALAQLNRLSNGSNPDLSHLRESDAIGQAADVVIMLGGIKENILELSIVKQRDGPTGSAKLWCDPSIMRIEDDAPAPISQQRSIV